MVKLFDQCPQWPEATIPYLLGCRDVYCLVAVAEDNRLLGALLYIREKGNSVRKVIRLNSVSIIGSKLSEFVVSALILCLEGLKGDPAIEMQTAFVVEVDNLALSKFLLTLGYNVISGSLPCSA